MRHLIIIIGLVLMPLVAVGQSFTISGTISDNSTGETLIGATVVDVRSGKGAVTNPYGRYSLTMKRDSVELKVQYVGYEVQYFKLYLNGNKQLNVKLKPAVQLQEVTISAERVGDIRSSQMSATEMTMEKIKSVPVLFGEADIIKALQLMPGVQSGSEGNSGMYVRGGGPDENLFLLDGVPLYNVSHMGGFFSAFNTDAVKNVTLYKGSFPARFGGRLSSVLDVTQNNGNDQEIHGNASIGLIAAKASIEGPIVKDKTTFSLSARRTYAELLVIPTIMWLDRATSDEPTAAVAENADYDVGYWFYDVNAKLTHKFSERSRLYGSFYMGEDEVYGRIKTATAQDEDVFLGFKTRWGNMIGALRWNYVLTPKLFMNVTASYTQYTDSIIGSVEKGIVSGSTPSKVQGDYFSGIREVTGRVDFDYTPAPEHNVKFGAGYTQHWFLPEVAKGSVDWYDTLYMNSGITMDPTLGGGDITPAGEMTAFVEDDWSVMETLKINAGLHASGFKVQNSFYPSLQPRVSGRVMLNDYLSLKIGYAWMRQYVHLLSTTSITLPTDLWVPVTDNVKPMESHQVAGGIFYSLSGVADFSIEGYYKNMDNLIEYREGASFFGSSENWENLVVAGRGWSYGVEFLVQREIGRLTGWVGYTWSRTMRLFDREGQVLNEGNPFPAKYDRRHDLSVVLSYKLNNEIDFSATWVFSTGNTATLSTQRYSRAHEEPADYEEGSSSQSLSTFDGRNNFRMPNYHRLDLGANFHRKFKRARRTISVSVYNVYNRQNPYMVFLSRTPSEKGYPMSLQQLSLFPILPSVAYTLYF